MPDQTKETPEPQETRAKREAQIADEGFNEKEFDPSMLGLAPGEQNLDDDAEEEEEEYEPDLDLDDDEDEDEDVEPEDDSGDDEDVEAEIEDKPKKAKASDDPFAFLDEEDEEDKDISPREKRLLQELEKERASRSELNERISQMIELQLKKTEESTGEEEDTPLFTAEELKEAANDPEKLQKLFDSRLKENIKKYGAKAIEELVKKEQERETGQQAAQEAAHRFYQKYPQLVPFQKVVSLVAPDVLRQHEGKGLAFDDLFGELYDRVKSELRTLRAAQNNARKGKKKTRKTGQPDTGRSARPKGTPRRRQRERNDDPSTKGLDETFAALGKSGGNEFFTGQK